MKKTKEKFKFREVFNPSVVNKLAINIQKTWLSFKKDKFSSEINLKINELNFGARSSLIADTLKKYLPNDFSTAAQILIDSLGPEQETDELAGNFIIMPQSLFISRYGLEYYDISIKALYEMTKRFTAEGDIRFFLEKHPEKTLKFLHKLTQDKSPFARRLASEGIRPRLPLAPRIPQLQKDPSLIIEILEKLKEDPNLMVRRSVANNLNDISKDNPDIVITTLKRWKQINNKRTQWIISHALRTLLKDGPPDSLKLMGYEPNINIIVSDIKLNSKEIKMGDDLLFKFKVTSNENKSCKLMIDYVIHFMKKNGKQAPKVFKITKKTLGTREMTTIEKKQSFKKINTRTYYSGKHSLEIQINGKKYAKTDFILKA